MGGLEQSVILTGGVLVRAFRSAGGGFGASGPSLPCRGEGAVGRETGCCEGLGVNLLWEVEEEETRWTHV